MGFLTFIAHDGQEHVVEIQTGKSMMQLAVENFVPGIDADCGGACACGTCHVIVDELCAEPLAEPSAQEVQMLTMTPDKEASSRLSCQIMITDAMDGMRVRLPEFQM